MLVKDDTKALNRLQRDQNTAQSGGTELSLEQRELRDQLLQLSGSEFDTAYVNAMVEEHRKAIREFEREAGSKSNRSTDDSTNDPFTVPREKTGPVTGTHNAAIARELLPTLKMHLQQAVDLQQKIGGFGTPQNK